MERNSFFCNLGLYIKSVLVLILLLGGSGSAWADELTINNSTDTGKIPFDAGLCSSGYSIGQVIIPSDCLTALKGKKITKITFYGSSTSDRNFGSFSVYLKEIDYTRFSSTTYESWSGMTSCFSGSLTFSSATKTMEIGLDYIYNEGNLLLGFNQTSIGTYAYHNWYGKNQTGDNYTALYTSNANGTISGVKFLPKITFTYETPSSTPKPTGFSSSVTAFDSVDLSWTPGGEETQWQIKWNKDSDFDPAEEQGTLVDYSTVTNPYTLSGLSESTTYYAYVRAYIDEVNQSAWTGPVIFTTPEQYPTPTELTASNLTGSGTEVTLSWTNGVGTAASKWQIKYSTSSTFDPEEEEGMLVNNISTNPYTLTGLTANETYYVCVRADYSDNTENHYSDWTDKISFTPIEAWEDFSNGIPDTWYSSGFITNRSGYEGQAFTTNTSNVLRTPRLYAEKDETLSYDVTIGGSGSSYKITAQYSTDRIYWENVESAYTTSGTKTFTAPSTGYYWLRFVNGYYCSVDNLNGFGPADVTHEMALGAKSIPSTGTAHGDYTASIEVMELGGSGETVTAELYFDGVKVAESDATAVGANRDQTINLTFTPTETKTANMFIKVIYNGDTELTTDNQSVTISNTTFVLDEKGDLQPTMSSQVLRVNYTAQNGWNTICMPFALTSDQMTQLFGSGWTAYEINSYKDGVLSFKKVKSSLATATPYLVYAENVDEVEDEIFFKSVSIYGGSIGWASTNRTQTKGDASFIGTFAPMAAGSLTGKYGITTEGKLGKGSDKATIKGYRAYIEISGEAPSRLSIAINDDTTTDLGFVRLIDKDAKDIYNLQGQKVKKAGKGIYVVNGRKVIIK